MYSFSMKCYVNSMLYYAKIKNKQTLVLCKIS